MRARLALVLLVMLAVSALHTADAHRYHYNRKRTSSTRCVNNMRDDWCDYYRKHGQCSWYLDSTRIYYLCPQGCKKCGTEYDTNNYNSYSNDWDAGNAWNRRKLLKSYFEDDNDDNNTEDWEGDDAPPPAHPDMRDNRRKMEEVRRRL